MTIEELTRRVDQLEAALAERGIFVPPPRPDAGAAYERALEELARGNRKPLQAFLRKGGKIPT